MYYLYVLRDSRNARMEGSEQYLRPVIRFMWRCHLHARNCNRFLQASRC